MMIIICTGERAGRPAVVSSSGGEVLQCCLAQTVGQRRVIDRAGQQQGAHHRGHGHECPLMRAGLAPVGRLAGHEIDHFLDVAGGCAAHVRRLARRLGPQRRQGATQLDLGAVLRRKVGAENACAGAALATTLATAAAESAQARRVASANIASREGKWA
jgi:hypothetical protein